MTITDTHVSIGNHYIRNVYVSYSQIHKMCPFTVIYVALYAPTINCAKSEINIDFGRFQELFGLRFTTFKLVIYKKCPLKNLLEVKYKVGCRGVVQLVGILLGSPF